MLGRKIIYKESLDSTNNYAANLLKEGLLVDGTVIVSGEQTAGKGQRNSQWYAEPYKNIIFTCFVQHVNLSVDSQDAITHFVSLAILDFLKEKNIFAQIKWPNDILIGNSKISGVLIENQLKSHRCTSSIIGIGINVNQTTFGDWNASSMQLQTGLNYDIQELVFSLIEKLQHRFQQLQALDFSALKNDYLKNMWLKDQESEFEDQNGKFKGTIQGTDELGRLLIESNGSVQSYDLKEIKFLARNASAGDSSCIQKD
ncbi:MAG: biotin--[acetyl-CoA-carboxylase] ligase [Crocinitomicaceae bacterium]|nr:biotin--[acetyl-CoA-carboxylase] ligase [Crocinitomicaceae bacterium]